MKPASGNPNDCHNIDTLREWVSDLKDLAYIQRELVNCSRHQVEVSQKLTEMAEQKTAALEEKVELMQKRLAQYEIAFSSEHCNHVRRLN